MGQNTITCLRTNLLTVLFLANGESLDKLLIRFKVANMLFKRIYTRRYLSKNINSIIRNGRVIPSYSYERRNATA